MRNHLLLIIFLFTTTICAPPAYADCSYPSGTKFDSYYEDSIGTFLICNGTEWVASIRAGRNIEDEVQETSWWSLAFPKEGSPEDVNILQAAQRTLPLIKIPATADFNRTVDAIRVFINTNSVHNIDNEFYSYWHDIPQLLQRLQAAASNPLAPKPHMECSTRTALMYHISRVLGIHARPIVVYPDGKEFISHTYLSVNNPHTGRWHIQDPDLNVFWISKNSGERASTQDLLYKPVKENFLPCSAPQDCHYTQQTEEIVPYFSLMARLDIGADDYSTEVNLDRFNVKKLSWFLKTPQPYCELFKKGCALGEN